MRALAPPAARRAGAGGAIAPARATPAAHAVLALQRSAGNAAVVRTLARQVAPPVVHAVPAPMEFIASSTQTEATADWFTERIVQLMRRDGVSFVEAARSVARDNLTGHGEHATRSANLQMFDLWAPAPLRRAIAFSVAHYTGAGHDPNLDLVAQHLGPHGIATRALDRDYGGGAGAPDIVYDPTADEMRIEIEDEIAAMEPQLSGGQVGELMLFFDGHGDGTGMEGSDGSMFTLDQLEALNRTAHAAGIQLIIVSNECFQGAGTLRAENAANRDLDARIDDFHGLSAAERTDLHARLDDNQALIEFGQGLDAVAEDLGRIAAGDPHQHSATENVASLRLTMGMIDSFRHFSTTGLPGASAALNARVNAVYRRLPQLHTPTAAQIQALVADLDWISDHLIEEAAERQERVSTALEISTI